MAAQSGHPLLGGGQITRRDKIVTAEEAVRLVRDGATVANPVCGFQLWRSLAKASGGSPARWQQSTAMVWERNFRAQRPRRCQ